MVSAKDEWEFCFELDGQLLAAHSRILIIEVAYLKPDAREGIFYPCPVFS
jgi:hypothetical protein